jgi:hypothetical protein
MPTSSIETYTISAHPSTSSNPNHLVLPTNGNEIKIIITEPTPSEHDTRSRVHFLDPNNTTRTRANTMKSTPIIELIEISPPDSQNGFYQDDLNPISDRLHTDVNNASVGSWVTTQKNSSTNDRYLETRIINKKST